MSDINPKYRQALEHAGTAVAVAYEAGTRGNELAARALDKLAEHGIRVVGRKATVRLSDRRADGSFVMQILGTEMGDLVEVTLVPRLDA
ncbi:MAG: hypothetical protein UU40_C0017G0015 [Candidatus Uhrbacteria bacterium GW2011_GWD2_41_121]|nr:MAG: hypothetical protein UT52_C0017G0009 [Candidatus Uhrbacteria bacterium GW2011_GWE1_39_46]KKR63487.1 MAG: hypothetical protein UU04_C0017G0015 [Candidatus Uhrbacteria bacterium GW2011_GWC2_40_450]KKR89701.1 MAG: hypothetical protein UU40_C0017G0015 [Candidatus Uhrbacteria bacterium GW2011_GWD2_41_121]KKR95865.1 MAG: hypothetical protein UU46_C0012G0018 [Candidatus Uhrbacteria bacterium GW2011_GWD1_41_16]KKS10180.1 MAG: hypothetical protein UU63_C0037G0005 [Candidatus Uhrbacteria bacteriu